MKKALGILGGMGPQATLDLQQKILDFTDAGCDQDHIRVYVDNHTQIPDRIGAVLRNTSSPTPDLQESLNKLTAIGAECVVMPCISAHIFLPQLSVPPQIIFLDMLHVAAESCKLQFPSLKAGVLCTEAVAQSGLLTRYLKSRSIPFLYPNEEEQRLLGRLIFNVKAKTCMNPVSESLNNIATQMKSRGAGYFLLACTELPLINQYKPLPYPCVDSTAELAKAAVKGCGYELRREFLIKGKLA